MFLTQKTSTFDDFSLFFYVSDKKHKAKTSKVDVFSVSFGLNFEDEGANATNVERTGSLPSTWFLETEKIV